MTHFVPKGLTDREVQERLGKDGPNELPSSKARSIFHIAWEILKEPMFLLLVACGTIYLMVGETSDAVMLLAFVFVIMGITFYQERKTERALEALRDLSSPRALVIRNGEEQRIAGREVVVDDILVVCEGDRVPADAVLLDSNYLTIDESLLTGESVPVRKVADSGVGNTGTPGGDDTPWLFSGTFVVKGRGIARVTSTGAKTEIGKIGKALQSIEEEQTPLSRQTGIVVRNFSIAAFILCVLIVVFYLMIHGDWAKSILAGITLAMALIPEEFPVVLSIFLALGAWRISRSNVLTRRVPAVETLGAATVLCVDKTGTLTQNRMAIKKIAVGGEVREVTPDWASAMPDNLHDVIEFGVLASQIDPFDPMEKAFRELGETHMNEGKHHYGEWSLEHQYPLSDSLLAMSHMWKSHISGLHVVAAKGAPEAVADLCHLTGEAEAQVAKDVSVLAAEGLRVLAVARAEFAATTIPENQHDFDFKYLGLVGFADPIRPTVPPAIKECTGAGIRVVMITGDYPATAQNIAAQIGLPNYQDVVTGPQLDSMDDAQLAECAKNTNIFARVVPEQKLRIVKAFKSNRHVAAMTGDGVNDAPALKAADIGIAMGGRGTDVAREAAGLVLLDDDFSSIVKAVRLGRRIYDNLKKAFAYILAVHVPIAGASLIPVLLGWPVILLPVHIVFLEMVIDPACSVVFEMENEEKNVMKRPPRNRFESLLNLRTLFVCLLQGLGVLVMVMGLFFLFTKKGYDENEARTVAFASLLIGNLALIVANRSWTHNFISVLRVKNKAMWWVLGVASSFLLLVIYVPFLQQAFHFSRLHWHDLLTVVLVSAVVVLWLELVKKLNPRIREAKAV